MSTVHLLFDTARIDGSLSPYSTSVGAGFVVFGVQTRDSSNVSCDVQVGDARFFVQITDPGDRGRRYGSVTEF